MKSLNELSSEEIYEELVKLIPPDIKAAPDSISPNHLLRELAWRANQLNQKKSRNSKLGEAVLVLMRELKNIDPISDSWIPDEFK